MRLRVFAWYPVPVYSNGFQRDGFRWFSFVYEEWVYNTQYYYTYIVDLPFDSYTGHCKTSVLVK